MTSGIRFVLRATLILIAAAILVAVIWAAATPQTTPQQAASINPNAMPIDLNRGAPGLSRWLAAIRTRASILMIVAHPDDEDGGLLTYQTRGLGARGALLTLNHTRCRGGYCRRCSCLLH